MYPRPTGYGVWSAKVKQGGSSSSVTGWWFFMTDADLQTFASPAQDVHAYAIKFDNGAISFSTIGGFNELNSVSIGTLSTSYKTLVIKRDANGKFHIYFDSSLVASFVDTTYDVMDRMIINPQVNDADAILEIDDIYIPTDSQIVMTHEGQSIDTLGGITAWGNLTVNLIKLNSDALTVQTSTSADNSSWDAWVSLSGSAIQSAVKRYIKVKLTLTITPASFDVDNPARVLDYTVQFTSNSIIIALGDFSDSSCYDAVQLYGKLVPTSEWGFDGNEQFFYRVRNDSLTPDVTLTQATNLSGIFYFEYDYANLYSVVRASFGSFVVESSATDGAVGSALEILGRKVYDIGSEVLLNKDTNIAGAIASAYLTRLSAKRLRLKVRAKFMPQMELSDTASVTFKRDAFSSVEPFLSALVCNIIGVSHDLDRAYSEFELEEIV